MTWDSAIGKLKTLLPPFNEHTIDGYRKAQVKRFPEFVDTVFREAVPLFGGALIYHGYRVMSPERRIAYNVDNVLTKGKVNIQQSELELLEFMFEFENQMIPVFIYLPYLYNGALVINDTRFYIQHAIIERMIFRVTDGVIIKVMRSPLQFWRTEQFAYTTTDGQTYYDAVIQVKAHYRKEKPSSRVVLTPLVLYLLSEFDFDHVVTKTLGLPVGAVSFVSEAKKDDVQFAYFRCKEGIYLKVEKDSVLGDTSFRRFVASLLFILQMSKRYTIADVYDKTFYKTLLGKNLYGMATKEGLAAGHAEGHLNSLRTYLDQFTKRNLAAMHIYCNDIFDLFVTVFFNIDSWLIGYSSNDLFEKRVGGADLILMNLVKSIFTRFYDTLKKNKVVQAKHIRSMLRMDPMKILGLNDVPSVQASSSMYNDNDLIAVRIKKIRQTSTQENATKKNNNLIQSKEHQFHPSFLAIESALAISSSSPGTAGDLNPYAVIDSEGCFVKEKMPWYKEILPLSKYLVQV